MHEPVEILSPSRRSSLPHYSVSNSVSLLFLLAVPPPALSPPFLFLFLPSLSLSPCHHSSRGARLLATFEFNFRTQQRRRKTFTGYKESPMEGANCGLKKKNKRITGEARGRETYASDRKTDVREMANVIAERFLRESRDEARWSSNIGTHRDVSKFF